MAYRRAYKRKTFRRRGRRTYKRMYRRKFGLTKNKTALTIGKGMPKTVRMTHTWVQNHTLDMSNSEVVNYLKYSANSLFSPFVDEPDYQTPSYFIEMGNLYNFYEVIGSKIVVKLIPLPLGYTGSTNSTTSVAPPTCMGLFLRDTGTNPTINFDLETINSQPSAFYKFVAPLQDRPVTLVKKWSQRKTFGKYIRGDDDMKGTFASNPDEQSYFYLYGQQLDQSNGIVTRYHVEVTITYIANWTELKTTQFNLNPE